MEQPHTAERQAQVEAPADIRTLADLESALCAAGYSKADAALAASGFSARPPESEGAQSVMSAHEISTASDLARVLQFAGLSAEQAEAIAKRFEPRRKRDPRIIMQNAMTRGES